MICHKDTKTQSVHKGCDFAALANYSLRPLREMDLFGSTILCRTSFVIPNLKS